MPKVLRQRTEKPRLPLDKEIEADNFQVKKREELPNDPLSLEDELLIEQFAVDQRHPDEDLYEDIRPDFPELGKAAHELFATIDKLLAEEQDLGEAILEEVKEEEKNGKQRELTHQEDNSDIPHQLQSLFIQLGTFLARYRSGPMPKALKFIPKWENWEQLLLITEPERWSAGGMKEMTRIFTSANKFVLQRFLNLFLLPAVRANIAAHRKLKVHYFTALKTGIFKADAWLKAILFPLLMDQATLREAVIIGAVLSKSSIAPLIVAAAIVKLCSMFPAHRGWTPASCYIIGVLFNKKTSLPESAVEAGVQYFESFTQLENTLPVIWHTSLLIFVQRYKMSLSKGQRQRVRDIVRVQRHPAIREEILKELEFVDTSLINNGFLR